MRRHVAIVCLCCGSRKVFEEGRYVTIRRLQHGSNVAHERSRPVRQSSGRFGDCPPLAGRVTRPASQIVSRLWRRPTTNSHYESSSYQISR